MADIIWEQPKIDIFFRCFINSDGFVEGTVTMGLGPCQDRPINTSSRRESLTTFTIIPASFLLNYIRQSIGYISHRNNHEINMAKIVFYAKCNSFRVSMGEITAG